MSNYPAVILASASPRRYQLLEQVNIPILRVIPADIDETPLPKETPQQLVQRLSLAKLHAVLKDNPDTPILAADTVVALGRRAIGKPKDRNDAEAILKRLSGRRHKVITAIALANGKGDTLTRTCMSQIRFKNLTQQEITQYLDSNEWQDKAGGYAIQGQAAAFIAFISGSHSNIMGLPLFETCQLLKSLQNRSSQK